MRPLAHWLLPSIAAALFACNPTTPLDAKANDKVQVTGSATNTNTSAHASQINQQPITTLKNPKIIVHKAKRILQVFDGTTLVRQYPIGLGFNPQGTKSREGDGATPEGNYHITRKNPNSNFYLSLGISYPNTSDADRGLKAGLIDKSTHQTILKAHQKQGEPPQKTALGGEIFIHGRGSSRDWTWGCVALDDANMKELFSIIPERTPIQIQP
jgi:murein L,D-transpeptidase YafK